jgi:hypothetical protein
MNPSSKRVARPIHEVLAAIDEDRELHLFRPAPYIDPGPAAEVGWGDVEPCPDCGRPVARRLLTAHRIQQCPRKKPGRVRSRGKGRVGDRTRQLDVDDDDSVWDQEGAG